MIPLLDLGLLALGGVLLYFGAEWLVGGSTSLALNLRVPRLLIGLTVVSYGTSAPEIIVGGQASFGGHGAIALGNAVGSNIANLGLILGLSSLIKPPQVDRSLRQRELPMLLATAALLVLALLDGKLQRWESVALLAGAIVYTAWMVRSAQQSKAEVQESQESAESTAEAAEAAGVVAVTGNLRHAGLALVGLLVLLLGGHFFVQAATSLARAWGMSDRVVGLTVVAVGTSLPELATSIIAAFRGQSDIAVGNVVGSNIFNVLLCAGFAGLVHPIEVPFANLQVDLAVLVGITLLGVIALRTERQVTRAEGAVLLASYAIYTGYLLHSG
jgi:cation:H+ antiporter